MKAAVLRGPPGSWPERPLEIEEVDEPATRPSHVLVKVAACGLCHTDLLYLRKGLPPLKAPPIILGHEASGVVVETGEGVKHVRKGDRVIVSYLIPCGRCVNCRDGRENICLEAAIVGSSMDGALAEYLSVPGEAVFKIPDNLPLEESSILTDAVASSYHAVMRRARVRPGESVAVYGASGGLGLNVVQFAAMMEARVIGIGRKKWKLEVAARLGASEVISTLEERRPDKRVEEMTRGGADVAIDATGDPSMISMACRSVRRGGRVVVLGYAFEDFQAPSKRLLWYELDVLGSCNYKLSDLQAVIRLAGKGRITLKELVSHRLQLSDVNKGYELLERGEVLRAIVTPP